MTFDPKHPLVSKWLVDGRIKTSVSSADPLTPVSFVFESVGEGWWALLDHLMSDLFKLGWSGMVLQVKEKFGGLRFYVGLAPQSVLDRIREAENESFRICEKCGQSGEPYRRRNLEGGWVKTLCEKHKKEFDGEDGLYL